MIDKITLLRKEVYAYILMVDELKAHLPNWLDLVNAYNKIRLSYSWIRDIEVIIDPYIQPTINPDLNTLFPQWEDLSPQEKLDFLISSLQKANLKIKELLAYQEIYNEEIKKNIDQAKLDTITDPSEKEIMDEILLHYDEQFYDLEPHILMISRHLTEARFFLEYILEKY